MTDETQELWEWSAEDMSEIDELRIFSARLMGWHKGYVNSIPNYPGRWLRPDGTLVMQVKNWTPDRPETGQIWLVVKKMRELGWSYEIMSWNDEHKAHFGKGRWRDKSQGTAEDTNPCLAILKAAKATGVEVGDGI